MYFHFRVDYPFTRFLSITELYMYEWWAVSGLTFSDSMSRVVDWSMSQPHWSWSHIYIKLRTSPPQRAASAAASAAPAPEPRVLSAIHKENTHVQSFTHGTLCLNARSGALWVFVRPGVSRCCGSSSRSSRSSRSSLSAPGVSALQNSSAIKSHGVTTRHFRLPVVKKQNAIVWDVCAHCLFFYLIRSGRTSLIKDNL